MTPALHNPHGTAFGLMDEVYGPGTAQALRDSGGPWEFYDSEGFWVTAPDPSWRIYAIYRLKPQPPKPREWWIRFDPRTEMFFQSEKPTSKDMGYFLVREVIE